MRKYECELADLISRVADDLNITDLPAYQSCIYTHCSCPIYCKSCDEIIGLLCDRIVEPWQNGGTGSEDYSILPKSIDHLYDLLQEIDKRKLRAIDTMFRGMDDESRYQAPILRKRSDTVKRQIKFLENVYNVKVILAPNKTKIGFVEGLSDNGEFVNEFDKMLSSIPKDKNSN